MPLTIRSAIERGSRVTFAAVASTALVAASVVPLLVNSRADAAQLTSRKITIGGDSPSSANATKPGQTGVTYKVDFTIPTTGNVGGIVVDFCSDSPVIGIACTAPTGFTLASATLASQGGALTGFAKDAASDANTMVLTKVTATSISGAATFNIGVVTNPTAACDASSATVCTFYARILTYAANTGATGYTSAAPGTYVDAGGVALSTANQLTISGRVQEKLNFCVGTAYSGVNTDCRDLTGTSIDLGVIDTAAISTNSSGRLMVKSNAANGTVITYFVEKDTTSGQLKVVGATCAGTLTDQCFDSASALAAGTVIAAGTEKFGMRAATNAANGTTNGTTNNIAISAPYNVGATTYGWDDTGTATLASSAAAAVKVLDDEVIDLTYAATASATTPTGQYTVTQTFIATSTY